MDESDIPNYIVDYVPHVVVSALFAFMVWVRMKPYEGIVQSDIVYFAGNDPWYHARIVHLTVAHFPATPRFDPWSYFPYGTGRHSGFGGIFDQLIATGAMLIGLGDPSPHLIDVSTAVAPVLFGALTVIPVFLVAKRLTGTAGGLISAALLSVLGGQFLSRTVVGSADHQSAEALFGAVAILGFLYAVTTAYREKPTVADLRDRTWVVLRQPVIAGIIGGVGIASYLMLWGPGVMLVFTIGIFVVLQMIRDHLQGRPTEYLAFGSVITMIPAAGLTLLYAKSFELNSTAFSLLQPLVPFGIAIGAVVLFLLSEYVRREDYTEAVYPIAVMAVIAVSLGVAAVVYPKSIKLLSNLIARVYSFGLLTDPSQLTVAEIQPADLTAAWQAFGAVFYLALIGLLIMVVRNLRASRPAELLVILWSLNILSAYFTMIRFGYYLAINVAVLAGFAIWWVGRYLLAIDADISDISAVRPYQVVGVLIILIIVVPGNVVAIQDRQPVWDQADHLSGSDTAWHTELGWMRDNTPEVPLDYTARFRPPEDEDFEYPDGAYGVMSWWDYGHWITTTGHRIPNANPFQQGQIGSSMYLQAQTETRANLLLEALPSLKERDPVGLSNAELRSIIESQSEQQAGEDTRYVVIDDQMLGGKFAAIATWTGPGYGSYVSRQEFDVGGQTAQLLGVNDQYHDMLMAELYFRDASGLGHYRLVHESESVTTFVSIAQRTPGGFQSVDFINRRLNNQVFAAVQQRQDLAFYDIRQASRVKTFERVRGARITGAADVTNGTVVLASIRLQSNTGRNFTYVTQTTVDTNGRFTVTVPYASTGNVAPAAGGTNSGIEARGGYRIVVGNPLQPSFRGTVAVPESAIYEGSTVPVDLSAVDSANQTIVNASTVAEPGEARSRGGTAAGPN